MSDILKDIVFVNKKTIEKTGKSIKNNWMLFLTGIIYTILNISVYSLLSFLMVGPMAIFSGILSAVISSAFISNYLYLLYNVINYNRITMQNFKDGFGYFLSKIYGVFFIGYIASLLLSFLTNILGNTYIIDVIVSVSIAILLNPLPETIYLKSYNSMESISYSMDFMKDNWLNWLIPNSVFIIVIYLLTGQIFGQIFSTHLNISMIFSGVNIVKTLLGQLLFTVGMIYRGHLYKLLSTGSRRKRMFMNQF